MVTPTHHAKDNAEDALRGLGERIREARTGAGISQRELARRLEVSPSLISQIESGASKPSVGTIYGIVNELGISLDEVIRGESPRSGSPGSPGASVIAPADRQTIDLASGVRWEQLAGRHEDGVDFLHAVYDVGGASAPDEELLRHSGREYGYVISGRLGIQIGFEEYELGPGDAITFQSTHPHRLYNKGDVPVHAIWFQIGRHGS